MKHAVHGPLFLPLLLSITACSAPDGSVLGAPNLRSDGLHPRDVVVLDGMGIGIEGVLIATHSSCGVSPRCPLTAEGAEGGCPFGPSRKGSRCEPRTTDPESPNGRA